MRFQYDFAKDERYKETTKFSFPQLLDMSPYLELDSEGAGPSDPLYELFSVVIHSGNTYGGHYKTYIRDIQNLGHWVPPEEEKILVSYLDYRICPNKHPGAYCSREPNYPQIFLKVQKIIFR